MRIFFILIFRRLFQFVVQKRPLHTCWRLCCLVCSTAIKFFQLTLRLTYFQSYCPFLCFGRVMSFWVLQLKCRRQKAQQSWTCSSLSFPSDIAPHYPACFKVPAWICLKRCCVFLLEARTSVILFCFYIGCVLTHVMVFVIADFQIKKTVVCLIVENWITAHCVVLL